MDIDIRHDGVTFHYHLRLWDKCRSHRKGLFNQPHTTWIVIIIILCVCVESHHNSQSHSFLHSFIETPKHTHTQSQWLVQWVDTLALIAWSWSPICSQHHQHHHQHFPMVYGDNLATFSSTGRRSHNRIRSSETIFLTLQYHNNNNNNDLYIELTVIWFDQFSEDHQLS